ncbi:hypothetical protein HN615_10490 [Candidatus Woesearchaeota archaeon]|nr:hypothetical protein [Lentimicrobiaceae bacterium]MBT7557339.1 hypothetical protein [Candidatus Woesearchaeota archaeon]
MDEGYFFGTKGKVDVGGGYNDSVVFYYKRRFRMMRNGKNEFVRRVPILTEFNYFLDYTEIRLSRFKGIYKKEV